MKGFELPLLVVVVVLAAAAAAATVVVSESSAATGGEQFCGHDTTPAIKFCKEYVVKEGAKKEPSKRCCVEVRKYNIHCFCKYAPESMLRMISMDKAVFVARRCGRILPKGIKCGKYVVPMAA